MFNASHHNGRAESGPVGFYVMAAGGGRHIGRHEDVGQGNSCARTRPYARSDTERIR